MFSQGQPISEQCFHHTELCQLTGAANQLTGFYIRGILVFKRLKISCYVGDKKEARYNSTAFQ